MLAATSEAPTPSRQDIVTEATPPPEGFRLFAISAALVLLVIAQQSGQVAADTKLDLVVDPGRFLLQSLSLWDPTTKAGGLQNQAYGYLFPMGPFFVLGHVLHLPAWIIQRLWESGLLVASFLGTFRVARLLGVKTFWPAVVAGLVYALSPRMLGELTSISAELTPTAALPWILAPLIRGANGASPRRSAALSGVALLFAGGTNAAATLAVLPVPALWLITRARGPRRRALMGYWAAAVALACLWWIVPLVLLGRYSSSFLDWIEAAQNTTSPTSLSAVLRGVPHWENYLGPGVWPAGWIFVSSPVAIMATTAVAAVGLFGLASRDLRHRSFLIACLAVGLVLVTLGHPATVGPPFAADWRRWLDGPLVAFRNIHKFEPLVRLPIAVGCGMALSRARWPARRTLRRGSLELRFSPRALAIGCTLVLGVLAIAPAMAGRLVSQPRTEVMAPWWPTAAQWIADHADRSRALVVPGAPKPTYIWGSTVDDALEPVARSPWITRDSTPLYQAGFERLLTEVEQLIATGGPVPELAPLLARSGIRFVVLRNDLEAVNSAATPQDIVRATLTSSPGLTLVHDFGPRLGAQLGRNDVVDGGAAQARPAIEIFQVDAVGPPVSLAPLDHAVVANGSTEELVPLIRAGLPSDVPVFFGRDGESAGLVDPRRVMTDGIRRQQSSFGGTFARSGTLTATEPFQGSRAAYDFLPARPGALSTMRFLGIRDVSASSSGSDAFAVTNISPASQPWSALDGVPSTAWESGERGAVNQWLQVEFVRAIAPGSVSVSLRPGLGPYPTALQVMTDAGSRVDPIASTSDPQTLALPAGRTTFLRLTVAAVQGGGLGNSVGISTLTIPGVLASRTLDVPGTYSPQQMTFAVAPGYRSGCLPVRAGVSCANDLVASGEEDAALDRTVHLSAAGSYRISATVRLAGGHELDRLLDANFAVKARASSTESIDPRVRAGEAVDGDNRTTWIAAPGDRQPSLTLTLRRLSLVRGIRLETNRAAAAAAPTRVRVTAGSSQWVGNVPASGAITLDHPVRTDTIKITVLEAELRKSTSMLTGQGSLLPAGISTVTVDDGLNSEPPGLPSVVSFGCEDGLAVVLDGVRVPLAVQATTAAVLAGRPVAALACDDKPVALATGVHRITLARTSWALPVGLDFAESAATPASPSSAGSRSTILNWGSTDRRVAVAVAARSVLVVHENYNRGWVARVGDRTLQSIQVDGWQQAFVVPPGTDGVVTLKFTPQRSFDIGLLVGAAAALLLVIGALVRSAPDRDPAVGDARMPRLVAVMGVLALGWLVAGAAGLVTVVLVTALRDFLYPTRGGRTGWLAAAALMIAGIDIAVADGFNTFSVANSGSVQLLTLAAVVLAAGSARRRSEGRQGRVP